MNRSSLTRRPIAMAYPRVFSLPLPWIGFVYLVGYVALDWISFIHPFAPFGITPWNPQAGLSFVLVLLFGLRFVPLLFVAPWLADLLVRHLPFPWPVQLITVAIIGSGYALGLMFIVRPRTRFNPALTSMRDLLVLLAVAMASAVIVSVGYVAVLVLGGVMPASEAVSAAIRYWVGDVIGVAVVTPFLLILLTRGFFLKPSVEAAFQVAAIVFAQALVIMYGESHHFQLFYLLFLPIIWLAVRGGLEVVTVGILLTQIGLILGLQLVLRETDATAFQLVMLVLTMTGLVAGALVTEHRRTESQLRLHQDSLARVARLGSVGELAAAVAHEINQPLMAAGTYTRLVADALRANDKDDALAIETAGKAVAQVERASEVVRRLRALIRLDQSGRAPNRAERIVNDVLDISRPVLDRHRIAVRTEVADALPAVMVDLLQIEQVLLNLIRNSVEAMSEMDDANGMLTIGVSRIGQGSMIAFEVRDTGPGFPADFAEGEFPPFLSAKPDGLGVGLSLSRSIVESHGGHFELSSDRTGAVVRFSLPAA